MKRLFTLPFFLFLFFTSAFAQLSLQNGTSDYLIDFNSTVTGVNSGSFTGSGFTSNPNSGQLDTDAWATTGLSDGAKNFGISNASGDHARGSNDGGVSTGGIYGFDIGGGNRALGIQPTGSDWTPGTITLKIVNNSSSVINDMDIDYNIFVRNDQNRASSFNFSYSFNNSSFTDATGANYTSPQSSGGTAWIANSRNVQLSNLSLNPGDDFYIRWSGSDAGGSGSRDEFALDDIAIMAAGSSSSCTQPTAQATNLNFGTITSNSIQATFSASSADKFLVVQSTNPSLGAAPTDGVIYTAGNPLGTGEVLQFSNSTSINALALASNTTYYYSIFAANDNCSGGPDYLSTNPLTGSAATTSGGSNYYDGIGSETCADLKTALYNLIDGHTTVSYNSLWTHYQTTDDHLNDAGTEVIVWDMYSDNPNGPENEFTFVAEQCGSYTGEGSCYNREHTFPKSWWGGSTSTPQYTDLFTVLPADGWINGVRNNNPYGEVQSGTESQITNNGSALGSSSITIPGYSGSVFEPIDEYKGDLARGYFYMATRYENVIAGWENNNNESDAVMNGTSYPVYEQWMIDMLISWHNSDPVDTKEIERNEAVFGIQGNRNPFIDHPEYVGLIWSNCGGGGDTEAPTNPTNLMANNTTETSTSLSWTISNDNIGVAGYYIYQDGINVLISNGTGTSADITGLNSSTTYNFYVTAFDAAGNESTASNSINVTTNTATDTEAPTTPSALAASNTTETSTDLNWNPSSDNIAVVGYNVYQDAALVATASNNSSTINGLTESTTYNFYVTAFDAAGNESTASNSINVTTATSNSGPTVLHEGYFESGWDGWQDGGSDCARYSGANSYEGSYSIRIRDNSGTSSAMTSPSFDLSNHNNVDITFSFMAKSMESNEDFWLRYFDGNSWQTVATYSRGNEFNNNTFYTMNVVLNSNDYNFPTNAQFRFQCDASANNDKIFVDAVIITADVSPSNLTRPGSNAITQVEAVSDNDVAAELEMELELELESEKVFENKSITIYPNPTSNFLNVNLQSFTPELSQMTIVNTMGQVVRNINNNLSDKIIQIDVSSLSKGIYFLRVVDNNDELQTLRFYVH